MATEVPFKFKNLEIICIILSYVCLQSWESVPPESRSFSSDITPLILAAHLDHFEIVRMLLDRGATIHVPHDVRY